MAVLLVLSVQSRLIQCSKCYIVICCIRLNVLNQEKQKSFSDLEVVVAGESNKEVEKKTFAVFINLWSVVVQTWKYKNV